MSVSSSTEPATVLLVEDNPGDVRLTKEAFSFIDEEVEFHVATDGGEALRYVRDHLENGGDHTPDLILLDLNLPRASGFDILDFLQTELENLSPPVLVLSSSTATEDIERSYQLGCNAYLTKPDDMREFSSLARSIATFWLTCIEHPRVQG